LCHSSRIEIVAEHETKIRVHAELKTIAKEADDERKLIDEGSPKIMMQGLCL
jgi:hypothetical protein